MRLVGAAGDRTSRKELIAALIFAANPNGEDLAGHIRLYRKAIARDALLDPDHALDQILFEVRKPGPRRRRPT